MTLRGLTRRGLITGAAAIAAHEALGAGIGSTVTPQLGGGIGPGVSDGGSLGGVRASDVTFTGRMAVHDYNFSPAGLAAFDSWFGRAADYSFVFVSQADWTSWDSSIANIISTYASDPRPKIWAVGLNVVGTSLDSAAAGSFNSHYLSAAQSILADAPASGFIFIRVAHEFNLAGNYPWEVINSGKFTQYNGGFRQLVTTFRSVSPRFRFIWNPNWITTGPSLTVDLTQAYPGDAYVDVIATDFYYDSAHDDPDPDVAFNYFRDLPYSGGSWLIAFARSRRKALALCEFGTNWDKPKWIDNIYTWTSANGFAYVGYWDNSAQPTYQDRLSDNSKPDAGARFIADFKNGGPVPIFNKTFAFGNEGFSAQGASASFSVVSQVAQVTGVSNFSDKAQCTISNLTVGVTYRIEMLLHTNSLNARVAVLEGTSPFTNLADNTYNTSSLTLKTFTFTATKTSALLQIIPYAGNASQVVKFDTVQMYLN